MTFETGICQNTSRAHTWLHWTLVVPALGGPRRRANRAIAQWTHSPHCCRAVAACWHGSWSRTRPWGVRGEDAGAATQRRSATASVDVMAGNAVLDESGFVVDSAPSPSGAGAVTVAVEAKGGCRSAAHGTLRLCLSAPCNTRVDSACLRTLACSGWRCGARMRRCSRVDNVCLWL